MGRVLGRTPLMPKPDRARADSYDIDMRIAIFGAGAVGGYFGGRLAETMAHEVIFIARGDHLEAIRNNGLRLESLKGDALVHPVVATDDPSGPGPVDVVLVGVKAWQLPEAGRMMRPLIDDATLVVPLQNGVEAATELAEEVGPGRVVGGMCRIFSTVAEPGVIRHTGNEPYMAVGELDNRDTQRIQRLRDTFDVSPGFRVEIAPDILAAVWEKFLFVTPVGEVGSVTGAPLGVICSVPETRSMLEQAMAEVAAVARARGVQLGDDAVERALDYAEASPANATLSMQRDLTEGRRSELDAQTGAVVRLGRASHVPTPLHEVLYASLLPVELRARGGLTFPSPG